MSLSPNFLPSFLPHERTSFSLIFFLLSSSSFHHHHNPPSPPYHRRHVLLTLNPCHPQLRQSNPRPLEAQHTTPSNEDVAITLPTPRAVVAFPARTLKRSTENPKDTLLHGTIHPVPPVPPYSSTPANRHASQRPESASSKPASGPRALPGSLIRGERGDGRPAGLMPACRGPPWGGGQGRRGPAGARGVARFRL